MSREYEEKRDFIRMITDHDLSYRELTADTPQQGICRNLSASGILFTTHEAISEGTRLEVTMTPRYSVVAPFVAQVEVVRSETDGDGNRYSIAGKILSLDSA